MCLLIVESRVDPATPLVVGANRDERLDRPATAMARLDDRFPRVIGGRDDLAGGTWLAVNEVGVVAALTNRPAHVTRTLDGPAPPPAPRKARSRGELPLLLARHANATEAVEAFVEQVDPDDYHGAWFLVGDRSTLHSIDMTNGAVRRTELPPGRYVLENRALGAPSPKVAHVQRLLAHADLDAAHRVESLRRVLADHEVPAGAYDTADEPRVILPACVHADWYGTRWSAIVTVDADTGLPDVRYADGPPCTSPLHSAASYWTS